MMESKDFNRRAVFIFMLLTSISFIVSLSMAWLRQMDRAWYFLAVSLVTGWITNRGLKNV